MRKGSRVCVFELPVCGLGGAERISIETTLSIEGGYRRACGSDKSRWDKKFLPNGQILFACIKPTHMSRLL